MAKAVELAALVGSARVEEALGLAAVAGRFDDGDLAFILDHLSSGRVAWDLITPVRATWPSWHGLLGRLRAMKARAAPALREEFTDGLPRMRLPYVRAAARSKGRSP